MPRMKKISAPKGMIHACCLAHSRRKFIEAIKVQTKAHATDPKLDRVVVLMDGLFAIDREAREQKLSLEDRHALRQERVPVILGGIACVAFDDAGVGDCCRSPLRARPISYTLTRWEKLTCFMSIR